ncbi:hypothetical protein [Deinococcus sp.]|uniref:hypothetical protein n=1 Tax=Deinococcus sp. TaxID=47478 RepID=UPI003B5BFC4B
MPTAKHAWPRLWTALLCLAASFAYLTRETQMPGGAAGAHTAVTAAQHEMVGSMVGMAGHGEHQHHAAANEQPSPTQPHESRHNHAAHCPFCFSAAFALEAWAVSLSVGAVGHPVFVPLAYREPHLIVAGLISARAPPLAA